MKLQNSRELLGIVSDEMARIDVEAFADSGTLLGILRGGDLLSYDSDVDLGFLEFDGSRLDELIESCDQRGVVAKEKFYMGKVQGINFKWAEPRKSLPVHAHCYFRHADYWCSPQIIKYAKGQYWPAGTSQIHYARAQVEELEKRGVVPIEQYSVRNLVDPNKSKLTDLLDNKLCRLVYSAYYKRLRRPQLRAMQASAGKDRYNVLRQQASKKFLASYTWIVPERFFGSMRDVEFHDCKVRIPNEASEYLAYRYGDDWNIPNPNWLYFAEDGALYAAPYEQLAPRLEEDPCQLHQAPSGAR